MPVKPPGAGGPAKGAAKPAAAKASPIKPTSAKPPSAKTSRGKPRSSGKQSSVKPCPICGKPATEASRPFCSEPCRDVDLNRWLSNSYVIPAAKADDEDAE